MPPSASPPSRLSSPRFFCAVHRGPCRSQITTGLAVWRLLEIPTIAVIPRCRGEQTTLGSAGGSSRQNYMCRVELLRSRGGNRRQDSAGTHPLHEGRRRTPGLVLMTMLKFPKTAQRPDWEVELGVGDRQGSALCSFSRRSDRARGRLLYLQRRFRTGVSDRARRAVGREGKSCDTFSPLRTVARNQRRECPMWSGFHMSMRVNGELRQNGSTSKMIVEMVSPRLVHFAIHDSGTRGLQFPTGPSSRSWHGHEAAAISQGWGCDGVAGRRAGKTKAEMRSFTALRAGWRSNAACHSFPRSPMATQRWQHYYFCETIR